MIGIRKTVIFIHRWLGVALSLLFLLWFGSGVVMMYWSFPSVTAQDRLDRSPELDANSIRVAPSEAYAKLDPKTARVVGNYSSSRWVTRLLYHGLHSWDFPWLYKHRPLWDIVVIAFMLGGSLLCITSLVLAWRVLRRAIVRLLSRAPAQQAAASGLRCNS
jgi:hypothetical protein